MVKNYVDFYVYEESEQGLDMWSRDSMMYNLKKFRMGKNAITEEDIL